MRTCPFCDPENLSKLQLTKSRHSIMIFNLNPVTDNHFLIIPKKHVISLTELSDTEWFDLAFLLKTAREKLDSFIEYTGVNSFFNEGQYAGQTIDHFHLHLVYRNNGDGFKNVERTPSCRHTPATPGEITKIKKLLN